MNNTAFGLAAFLSVLACGAAAAAPPEGSAATPASVTAPAPADATAAAPAASDAPAPTPKDQLTILFPVGGAAVTGDGTATLDKASRLYRAGNPIVMIVSGSTDTTGSAAANLSLSERRARAVLNGLVDRGIPVQRLQLLAAGTTEPAVKTGPGIEEAENRRVVITWR